MCGRFTLKTPVANWLADLFPNWEMDSALSTETIPVEMSRARYNIAPTQQILVVRCASDGVPAIDRMRWGLIPGWADSLSVGYNMINARSESIADKPSFRPSLIGKRCAVIADGYYEWQKLSPKSKVPHWIHVASEKAFAMAGLWAENHKIQHSESVNKSTLSTTIITTESNVDVESIHDRMPALLLNETQIAAWLNPSLNHVDCIDLLLDQLRPSPSGVLQLRPVSNLVNSPANDSYHLLESLT